MLELYGILDTEVDPLYDEIAKLAGTICDVPIAAITFLDGERQWFKSSIGADIREAPVVNSFCTYTVATSSGFFAVENTLTDERFSHQPHVTNAPSIRAYAGASLLTNEGIPLGTICVYDIKARKFSEEQQEALLILSRQVLSLLDLKLQVSQLRIKQQQLLSANEQLDQFASMVSHDLNAPIRHQVSFANLLEEEYGDLLPQMAKQYLTFIKQAGDRALEMILDLREYVNTTRSAFTSLSPIALDELIGEVLEIHRTVDLTSANFLIDTRAINIIMTSRTALRHILINLIGNAIKYSDSDDTVVKIWSEIADGEVCLTVEDNGPGIDADDALRIFDPFNRGKSAINKPGRGLGLSIANKLAQNLGSKLILNTELGKGSRFTLVFPRY